MPTSLSFFFTAVRGSLCSVCQDSHKLVSLWLVKQCSDKYNQARQALSLSVQMHENSQAFFPLGPAGVETHQSEAVKDHICTFKSSREVWEMPTTSPQNVTGFVHTQAAHKMDWEAQTQSITQPVQIPLLQEWQLLHFLAHCI